MNAESRIERLDAFMKYKELNDNQMTVQCGLSVGLLGKARSHRSKLGEGTILKVSRAFPEVNVDWLLNGKGEMLSTPSEQNDTNSSRIERLDEFMRLKGLNDNQMTNLCGLSGGLIGKARSGTHDLSPKTIAKVLEKFPELNPNWIYTGEGTMLKSETPSDFTTSEPVAGYGSCHTTRPELTRLLAEITAQRKLTENAQRQTDEAQAQVNRLIAIIERLTHKPE
ncbi:MAG: helix-turn-helix domain-containing protein [Prevotellaceae bacterium]|nr:helix-turn-helix domain-containing protein [Prevotellaceae bacterium]